jgi:hypothetical protein
MFFSLNPLVNYLCEHFLVLAKRVISYGNENKKSRKNKKCVQEKNLQFSIFNLQFSIKKAIKILCDNVFEF